MSEKSFLHIAGSTYGTILEHTYDMVILPWGAVEPHNYHLPYLTDCILSYEIACDCAARAHEIGITCMVMPPVWFGSQNPGQWNKPFCIHTRSETQKAILQDVITSLYIQGFQKLVIVNGHGGNTFKSFVRDLAVMYPDFYVVVADWYAIVPTEGFFEENPDEHAGEQETSVMLHYHPELVSMERAGEGRVFPLKIGSVDKKTGWLPRNWDEVTADTGIGNPGKSSAEKGKRYAEEVVKRITELLTDLKKI